jgi:MFS family permease
MTRASPRPEAWALAACIASVTVFGLSIGEGAPLLSLLLEQRGVDVRLNGLNAATTFVGVLLGPLLAPAGVRRFGVRDFLLICFALDIVVFLLLKPLDGLGAWFVLRVLLGLIGSAIFTSSEAWINFLAGDTHRGRIIGIYAAALSAGFGIGPLLLSLTGLHGWPPFLANSAITLGAALPLLGVRRSAQGFGAARAAHPFRMAARAPLILAAVALFGLYESALMALLPIWGVRVGLSARAAAAALSAVYFGSIVVQVLIGWLSDRLSRLAALRLCVLSGAAGAPVLAAMSGPPVLVFALLFLWGGMASGIYPVALSMAGDRFRGAELVTVNAAIIMAYGLGGLAGPVLGGAAMARWDPRGLLWLFAAMFACLLALTLFGRPDRGPRFRAALPDRG